MAISFNGSSSALTATRTLGDTSRFSVGMWFQVANLSSDHTLFCTADNSTNNEYHRLYVDTSGNLTMESRAGGSPSRSTTMSGVSASTWYYGYGHITASGGDRYVSLDGASPNTEGSNRGASGLSTWSVGVTDFSTRQDWGNVTIAELIVDADGLWTDAKLAVMAKGAHPFRWQIGQLQFYSHFHKLGSDWSASHPHETGEAASWTLVGTPSIADHPTTASIEQYWDYQRTLYGGLGGNVAAPAGVTLHDRSYPQGVLRGHVRGAA